MVEAGAYEFAETSQYLDAGEGNNTCSLYPDAYVSLSNSRKVTDGQQRKKYWLWKFMQE